MIIKCIKAKKDNIYSQGTVFNEPLCMEYFVIHSPQKGSITVTLCPGSFYPQEIENISN